MTIWHPDFNILDFASQWGCISVPSVDKIRWFLAKKRKGANQLGRYPTINCITPTVLDLVQTAQKISAFKTMEKHLGGGISPYNGVEKGWWGRDFFGVEIWRIRGQIAGFCIWGVGIGKKTKASQQWVLLSYVTLSFIVETHWEVCLHVLHVDVLLISIKLISKILYIEFKVL